MSQPTVFISYSHKDEAEKEQLVSHLSVLVGVGLIDVWVDDRIGAGGDWAQEIDQAMERAAVAILLISANFLTSNFIRETEVPRLLERREKEGLAVFPIIAKHCAWQRIDWLAKLNVKPKNGTPVWREQGRYADEELAAIANQVATIINESTEKSAVPVTREGIIDDKATTGAPLVGLYNFNAPSERLIAEEAHTLDWSRYFDSQTRPRRVPDQAIWHDKLLPQLTALEQKIDAPGLVRLRGSAALSTGFAFGHVFKEIGRYQLEVEQFSDGVLQPWYAHAKQSPVSFIEQTIAGNREAKESVVIVFANYKQVLAEMVGAVGSYWGEAQIFTQNTQQPSQKFKQVLILEAGAASREKRELNNWEAATLAKNSSEQMRRFVNEVQPEIVHLFLAVPLALAVFLGHQWNILNTKIQCHEWVGEKQIYTPTCRLHL